LSWCFIAENKVSRPGEPVAQEKCPGVVNPDCIRAVRILIAGKGYGVGSSDENGVSARRSIDCNRVQVVVVPVAGDWDCSANAKRDQFGGCVIGRVDHQWVTATGGVLDAGFELVEGRSLNERTRLVLSYGALQLVRCKRSILAPGHRLLHFFANDFPVDDDANDMRSVFEGIAVKKREVGVFTLFD
jgi:hypothetical protein